MINFSLIERNKNKVVNLGIIILALFIALKFYISTSNQIGSLAEQESNELEKNKVTEEIAALEKKLEAYQKVFVRKDLASVMDIISGIAKDASVKIVSVKPLAEEAFDSYSNSPFLVMLNAPGYHVLGDFISKIENHKDILLISEVKINSKAANLNPMEANADFTAAGADLNVSLKINTIAYL
jgi:hypothetical protein